MKNSDDLENIEVLAQVAELTNQGWFIYNLTQHTIKYVNAAFKRIWGANQESIYEDVAFLLSTIHGEDKKYVVHRFEELIKKRQKNQVETRIVLPDNNMKWLCISAYVIPEEEKDLLLVGCVEDITQRKKYLQTLLKFNAKKNSILEILSHDLAAPFATIQGMTSLLERKIKPYNDPSINELLAFMKENCQRGISLIQDFVNNEFMESSEVKVSKQRVDIVSRIGSVIDEYKRGEELIPKQFELTFSELPIWVEIDDLKFIQVINNLISNAIKFTPDNGNITVSVQDKEDTVLLMVKDDGVGIPKHFQPILFDKFTKARRPGLKGEKSVGLGMSIIKTIVELHKGKIWFESEENKGATFFVEIPKSD